MAAHRQLTEATGVKVYFADPHSPWQRGIHENTNGRLRQYLPKGSDLSGFTQEDLDAIAWKLNARPRNSLSFRCPAELFTPAAFDFKQHHTVLLALPTGGVAIGSLEIERQGLAMRCTAQRTGILSLDLDALTLSDEASLSPLRWPSPINGGGLGGCSQHTIVLICCSLFVVSSWLIL